MFDSVTFTLRILDNKLQKERKEKELEGIPEFLEKVKPSVTEESESESEEGSSTESKNSEDEEKESVEVQQDISTPGC